MEIGSLRVDPPVLMAPMAGFTDHAFRTMVRRFGGVGLPAVEMVSARSFLEIDARKRHLPDRLWGVEREPRPLAVQIWDNDPESLARVGARLAHELQVSVVDINFGCPVKVISERATSGSYLLRYPDRVGEIVARVVEACRPTPVTAKIRLGPSRDLVNAVDVAQAIEGAGGVAVTVHGRTAAQMYRGRADWAEIARIKPHLRRIPLVGNGDLDGPESVVLAFERYGIDGVMIGREALGRPWLFRQVQAALAGEPIPPPPTPAEVQELLLAHYRLTVQQHGQRRGTVQMRKVACCYAQGWPGARRFRSRICLARTQEDFLDVIRGFFSQDGTPEDVGSA
jgi:tRNA-dihydrouridine synthase B